MKTGISNRAPLGATLASPPSLEELAALPPATRIFGIVGRGVLGSLSPRLHNAAYRALGLEAVYLPFPTDSAAGLERVLAAGEELAGLGRPLAGLTVVAPLKEAAAAAGRQASAVVRQSGAANLLVRAPGGSWRADSTDPQGVLDPLRRRRFPVAGRRMAVVGCGGSGRTIAAALDQAGARVTVVNRSRERGRRAAAGLGLPFAALADFDPRPFAAVVNATPSAGDGKPPFDPGRMAEETLVIDLAYGAEPTPLAAAARSRGLTVVDGREVLLAQTRHQIHAMTGRRIDGERLRSFLDRPGRPPAKK